MGALKSLKDVMEDVSKNLDAKLPIEKTENPINEFDVFVRMDGVLASLQKQYTDAKALRLKAQKEYGHDDGMTDMAVDLEDSAWCAVQTRYMELRDDRIAMQNVQMAIEEEMRVKKIADEKQNDEKAMDYYNALQKIKFIKEKNTYDYALVILTMIVFDSIRAEFFRIQNSYKFNALAA